MSFPAFLENLLDAGRVSAPAIAALSDDEVQAGVQVLVDFEQRWRWELVGAPPEFSVPAARWAAVQFYRACQFTVYRDVPAEVIAHEMQKPCEVPLNSAVHYSVDLTFRFLPDLVRFATSEAEQDPLVVHLQTWCQQWALSSVGVPGLKPENLDTGPITKHPVLLALYVDRILATKDHSRLHDACVSEAVRAALGVHQHLAPQTAEFLSTQITGAAE